MTGPGDQQGYQQGYPPAPQGYGPPAQQSNGMAVTGMVLGIIALVLFWIPVIGWILAILAIIFGGVGISRANSTGGTGKGQAIAGLVCGISSLALYIVVVAIIVAND